MFSNTRTCRRPAVPRDLSDVTAWPPGGPRASRLLTPRADLTHNSQSANRAPTSVASSRGGLGWTCPVSTPLLLDVAPETDTNPTSFYRGRGKGVSPVGSRIRLQTLVIGSRSALAMSAHPTYFDQATPCPTALLPSCSKGLSGVRVGVRAWIRV